MVPSSSVPSVDPTSTKCWLKQAQHFWPNLSFDLHQSHPSHDPFQIFEQV
jgi:hypothetical protein